MICEYCQKEFEAKRKSARFCSRLCAHNSWVIRHQSEWKQYNENWRAEHPDYWRDYYSDGKGREVQSRRNQKHPLERKARTAVSNAVRLGKIQRGTHCAICGEENKVEAHHWHGYDRDKWLDVQWLCREHHLEVG